MTGKVSTAAVAVTLYKHQGDELVACVPVAFAHGWMGADTVLRRAAIAGEVHVEGELEEYYADLLDANGDILQSVALDAGSYSALKNKWMRTTLAKNPRQ